jgi:hypothetical protein
MNLESMIFPHKSRLKITAVSGWAIATEWFHDRIAHSFPHARIKVIYPRYPGSPDEAKELLSGQTSDLYIGYSLGSLWLLHHRLYLPQSATKALLAPILAFTKEHDLGGKTTITQLKYLVKLLKSSSGETNALMDFYTRCNFKLPESWKDNIPDHQTLVRGLEFLGNMVVPAASAEGFLAIIGEEDNFLDPIMLKCKLPQLDIVKNTGHEPEQLLEHLARQLQHLFKT